VARTRLQADLERQRVEAEQQRAEAERASKELARRQQQTQLDLLEHRILEIQQFQQQARTQLDECEQNASRAEQAAVGRGGWLANLNAGLGATNRILAIKLRSTIQGYQNDLDTLRLQADALQRSIRY
jgi:butyrate kinase